MIIENELINIVSRAIKLNRSDIHFMVGIQIVEIRYRLGHIMPEADQYILLDEYKSLIAYIIKHAGLKPISPSDSKFGIGQSGTLPINDEIDHLFTCRVSLLPTKKQPSLILRIMPKRKGE